MVYNVRLVRIDDRLIHGQVITQWSKLYNIEQILIIDDTAKNDPVQKAVVKFSAPSGMSVQIFGVDEFAAIIQKNSIKKSTMLLFTNSVDVLKIVNAGLAITEVNAGGMRFKEGRKMLSKAISVTPEENDAFLKLIDKEIKVSVQLVPKDEKIDYAALIKNRKES